MALLQISEPGMSTAPHQHRQAVRMSLSFPLLLSAVPLYARDFTDDGKLKRVWFSDGGISSNMPLHFFDTLLPEHPTFAINLKEAHPKYPIEDAAQCGLDGRVYLPDDNSRGMQRYWAPSSDATPAGVFRFLANIFTTMQNWRDEILFPYPGYRDRIVQISLRPGEGGLNLNMPKEAVERLGDAGACAAEMLYRRFHPQGGGTGWGNHEQVQVLSVLGNLERPVRWIAMGLLMATFTGLGALFFGYPFLTTHTAHLDLPLLGEIHVASALFYDIGVFTLVVGATLLILTALGH
eukprot:gene27383-30951_t